MPFGDFYANRIYPGVSAVLSWLGSPFGFSLTEWVVIGAVVAIPWIIVRSIIRKKPWWRCLLAEAGLLLAVTLWFYCGWGFNYLRSDVYTRLGAIPTPYEEAEFQEFMDIFARELNENRCDVRDVDREAVERHVKAWYAELPPEAGLCKPRIWHHPKRLAFKRLYSGVGVLGFIGPFFDEMHVNADALPVEYPSVFAHEYAHVLGVSSEAEANFWAFEACRAAECQSIRYSAWFSLLNSTGGNIRSLLGEEAWQEWWAGLIPEVKADVEASQLHWRQLRWPWIARLQHNVYNAFLRGNGIAEGTRNYGQVLRLVLSLSDLHAHEDGHGEE